MDAVAGDASLAGKTIVVTGAGRGQGLAETWLAAAAGARVIGCDAVIRTPPEPGQLAGSLEMFPMDVSEPADWGRLGERIDSAYGGVLHGLVNNAGVTLRDRLTEVSIADWNRVQAVNCTGALLGIQMAAARMGPGASIVNVGSVAAFCGHYPVAYTVSKWALRGLSAVAATELGPRGIRVNAIHPGFVETEMTASAPAAFRDATWKVMPMTRLGLPEDIAHLVRFLLSDESAWINGADIAIDGGQASAGGAKVLSDALRPDGGQGA